MSTLDIILTLLDFAFSILIIFFTIALFHPINRFKRFKVKEEQLFLQKTLITTFFFGIFLLLNMISLFSDNLKQFSYLVINFLFNAFIILIIVYNLLMTIELYRTYINPVHYFNRLYHQKRFNYFPELTIFLICAITIGVDIGIDLKNFRKDTEDNNSNISVCYLILTKWKPFVIIIISIICIVLYCKMKSLINSFYFSHQRKLLNVLSKRSMNYYLYFIFGIFYLFPLIESLVRKDSKISDLFKFFSTLFFFIVLIDDYLIHISELSTSKFCEYPLKNTVIGNFCACFNKPKRAKQGVTSPLITDSTFNEKSDYSGFGSDISNTFDLVSNNIYDKELISVYKNGLFMEDYFMSYFDQILNIITASLYQVYNSKYFSTQANEQNISSKLKIEDISGIGGNMKDTSVSALATKTVVNTKNDLGDETVKFNIIKNIETDDLKRFEKVLENRLLVKNNSDFLNISVNSFMTTKCVESIYEQKIKGRHIASSLLGHMIFSNIAKNRNPDNPNATFWSLTAKNGKEQYFNKMKSTSFKTYDKNFTIDLFDTDFNDISVFEKGDNNSLAQLLDKYFTYVHGKGINGTFIPSLLGVFKIKINKFKPLLIFITRNSIVENAPKDSFSSWQLLRILKGKPQKVATSQFSKGNSLVKDDPIFDRAFQIETIKENPNYNKISVKNYNDFTNIINSDIEFLRQVGAKNFDLLLMYYQFENTQKHEKQGQIKIRQTNKGAELIEEEMPKMSFEDDITGTPSSKDKKGSFDGNMLSLNDNFLDDDNFGGKDFNMKKIMNDLDSIDNSNMNGYEGLFDNFNCLCYFTFENIFDIRNRQSINDAYYNSFKDNILCYFTDYKK